MKRLNDDILFESRIRELQLLGHEILGKWKQENAIYMLVDIYDEKYLKKELHRYGIWKYQNGIIEIVATKVLIGDRITILGREQENILVSLEKQERRSYYTINLLTGSTKFHAR